MGLELKRAQGGLHKATAAIPVGSNDGEATIESVDIWFRPLTAQILAQLDEGSEGQELAVLEMKARWLSKLLMRWTITDGSAPVEPSLDILRTFGAAQIDAFIEAISAYTYPKKTT